MPVHTLSKRRGNSACRSSLMSAQSRKSMKSWPSMLVCVSLWKYIIGSTGEHPWHLKDQIWFWYQTAIRRADWLCLRVFDVLRSGNPEGETEEPMGSRQPIMIPLRMGHDVGKKGHVLFNLLENHGHCRRAPAFIQSFFYNMHGLSHLHWLFILNQYPVDGERAKERVDFRMVISMEMCKSSRLANLRARQVDPLLRICCEAPDKIWGPTV